MSYDLVSFDGEFHYELNTTEVVNSSKTTFTRYSEKIVFGAKVADSDQ